MPIAYYYDTNGNKCFYSINQDLSLYAKNSDYNCNITTISTDSSYLKIYKNFLTNMCTIDFTGYKVYVGSNFVTTLPQEARPVNGFRFMGFITEEDSDTNDSTRTTGKTRMAPVLVMVAADTGRITISWWKKGSDEASSNMGVWNTNMSGSWYLWGGTSYLCSN